MHSRLIDQNELHEMAPYISKKMLGAAFCPIEGKANPLVTAPAFAARARDAGASIATGVEVLEISKENGKFKLQTNVGDFYAEKVVLTANAGLLEKSVKYGLRLGSHCSHVRCINKDGPFQQK